jgi:hypothetical protein
MSKKEAKKKMSDKKGKESSGSFEYEGAAPAYFSTNGNSITFVPLWSFILGLMALCFIVYCFTGGFRQREKASTS